MDKSYESIKKVNRSINWLKRKINIREKEYLKKSNYDVTHRELEYLVIIKDNEDKILKDILKTLDVSKSTWSNQLKTLVKKELILLITDNKDKRIKRAKLTNYGNEVYQVHKKVRILFLKNYSHLISNRDLEAIERIIINLREGIKKNNR